MRWSQEGRQNVYCVTDAAIRRLSLLLPLRSFVVFEGAGNKFAVSLRRVHASEIIKLKWFFVFVRITQDGQCAQSMLEISSSSWNRVASKLVF